MIRGHIKVLAHLKLKDKEKYIYFHVPSSNFQYIKTGFEIYVVTKSSLTFPNEKSSLS